MVIEVLTYVAFGVAVLASIDAAWSAHKTGQAVKKLLGK